jgi:hypothetical protein
METLELRRKIETYISKLLAFSMDNSSKRLQEIFADKSFYLLIGLMRGYDIDLKSEGLAYCSYDPINDRIKICFSKLLIDVLDSKDNVYSDFIGFYQVWKHEILHYINLHPLRIAKWIKRNVPPEDSHLVPLLISHANIVLDSLINRFLDEKFINLFNLVPPTDKDLVLEEELEKFYNELKKNPPPPSKCIGNSCQSNNCNEGYSQFNESSGNSSQSNNSNNNGNNNKPSNKNKNGKNEDKYNYFSQNKDNNENNPLSNDLMEIVKELLKKDLDYLKTLESYHKKVIREELKKVVETIKMSGIGNVPGYIEELINSYKESKIKIPKLEEAILAFKGEVLRSYNFYNPVNQIYSRSYPKPVLPSFRPALDSEILIIVDTSGSMGHEELERAFGLIRKATKISKVYVLNIDTEIKGKPIPIEKYKVKSSMRFVGRGGTNFADLERLSQILTPEQKRNIKLVILFTDGLVFEFPKTNPLPNAKWLGITTKEIPKSSPEWIEWGKIIVETPE